MLLPYILEKIGDTKFAESLHTIVNSMCKRIPGKYLVGHITKYIRSTEGKKPKLNSDACSLIVKIIENVSLGNIALKEAMEYAKETYGVPFSRKGAAELLTCIYSYVGEQIKTYLDANTYKAMEAEFKNVKLLTE